MYLLRMRQDKPCRQTHYAIQSRFLPIIICPKISFASFTKDAMDKFKFRFRFSLPQRQFLSTMLNLILSLYYEDDNIPLVCCLHKSIKYYYKTYDTSYNIDEALHVHDKYRGGIIIILLPVAGIRHLDLLCFLLAFGLGFLFLACLPV